MAELLSACSPPKSHGLATLTGIRIITAFTVFFFIWTLLSAIAILWILIRWSKHRDSVMDAKATTWPWGILDVLGAYLVMALFPGVALALLQNTSAGVKSLGTLVAEILALATILIWLRLRFSTTPLKQWFSATPSEVRDSRLAGIGLGLLTGLIAIPIILRIHLISQIMTDYTHPTLDDLQNRVNLLLIVTQSFRAIVVASVIEEVFYRGLLQGWLQRIQRQQLPSLESLLAGVDSQPQKDDARPTAPSAWPILASATLFALAHLNLGASAIPLFFFGLVLGYLFRRTGSLIPCIACHSLLNGYSIAVTLLGAS